MSSKLGSLKGMGARKQTTKQTTKQMLDQFKKDNWLLVRLVSWVHKFKQSLNKQGMCELKTSTSNGSVQRRNETHDQFEGHRTGDLKNLPIEADFDLAFRNVAHLKIPFSS